MPLLLSSPARRLPPTIPSSERRARSRIRWRTIDKNNCLMCHREQPADRTRQKGEIPSSHYAAPGKLSGERFECMLCHAESSQAKPLAPVNANDATED